MGSQGWREDRLVAVNWPAEEQEHPQARNRLKHSMRPLNQCFERCQPATTFLLWFEKSGLSRSCNRYFHTAPSLTPSRTHYSLLSLKATSQAASRVCRLSGCRSVVSSAAADGSNQNLCCCPRTSTTSSPHLPPTHPQSAPQRTKCFASRRLSLHFWCC